MDKKIFYLRRFKLIAYSLKVVAYSKKNIK